MPTNYTEDVVRPTNCVVNITYEKLPQDYGYYVCGPVLTLFIIVGIVGNILCLPVFCKPRRMPSVNLYLIPLCVFDLLLLLGSFFLYNLPHLLYGRMVTYGQIVKLYPYAYVFAHFSHTCCIWLIVILTAERYFALCHPLRHRTYDTKRRSLLVLLATVILALLYNVPRFFEIEVMPCYDTTTQKEVPLVLTSEFRNHNVYWAVYKLIGGLLFFSCGPFITLCVLSISIWMEIRRTAAYEPQSHHRGSQTARTLSNTISSAAWRPPQNGKRRKRLSTWELSEYAPVLDETPTVQTYATEVAQQSLEGRGSTAQKEGLRRHNFSGQSGSHERHHHVLTVTLLAVVAKFLVCHTLPAILDVCETVMGQRQFSTPVVEHLVDTSNLLVAINSSLNIFIYVACSSSFCRKLISIFGSADSDVLELTKLQRQHSPRAYSK